MDKVCERPKTLSSLEKLPFHLLVSICECLVRLEPRDRRSLFAFSLTSATCCNATDAERFRYIHLALVGPQKLQNDVKRWRRILQIGYRLGFVRMIKLDRVMDPEVEDEDYASEISDEAPEVVSPRNSDYEDYASVISDGSLQAVSPRNSEYDWYDEDGTEGELVSGLYQPMHGMFWFRGRSTAWADEVWQPLIDFMRELPALRDIIYDLEDQLPPPLLSVIHENHPESRLHMHRFTLGSLIHSELSQQAMSADDVALATSPCLRSIVVLTQRYDAPQVVDYNEEAVMAMVKGLAPRLENVSFAKGKRRVIPVVYATIPRPPWEGFPLPGVGQNSQQPSKGRIRNLVLHRDEPNSILNWSLHTDFQHLRSLRVGYPFSLESVRQLTQISHQTPMEALSSLYLGIGAPYSVEPQMDSAVAELLQTLRPLQELTLTGPVGEESLGAIIDHHPKNLHKLIFSSHGENSMGTFNLEAAHAKKLSQSCLEIEVLDVRVLRQQGSADEVAVYRHLSRLPRLKHLALRLHCSINGLPWSSEAEAEADGAFYSLDLNWNGGVTVPILQDAFKNAAFDLDLAMQVSRLLETNRGLRTLLLQPVGFTDSEPSGRWLRWIGREWRVRRSADGDVKIEELHVGDREAAGMELDDTIIGVPEWGEEERSIFEAAWNALWPRRSKQWWNDWSSFPLAQDLETEDK